jgi:hypothetical protein
MARSEKEPTAQEVKVIYVPAELQEQVEVSISTKGVYSWTIKAKTPERAKEIDTNLRTKFEAPVKKADD